MMAGNFFADCVKGRKWQLLPENYAEGVLQHRKIDSYVDQHPITRASKKWLSNDLGLFKGVFLDLYWDHFLCRDFNRLTGMLPVQFVDQAHHTLLAHASIFGTKATHLTQAMIQGNWLLGYAEPSSLQKIFEQMSRRFPYDNPLSRGVEDLLRKQEELHLAFEKLWEDLTLSFGTFQN